ncbi:MAG: hypothetical protein JRH20_06070 [Deltaproteobacteria bacterium]|nr:hypothetical protein [Deltaproteobacteria bacterium]
MKHHVASCPSILRICAIGCASLVFLISCKSNDRPEKDLGTLSDFVGGTCGNGTLEKGETCDTAIGTESDGFCPASCDDQDDCTTDTLVGQACQASCQFTAITTCNQQADGCCPTGCDENNDQDCETDLLCGNGQLDPGERCDTSIPTDTLGACPDSCDDGQACTKEVLTGDACRVKCQTTFIRRCRAEAKDGCCPEGCTNNTDPDCSATCGNGALEAGETCDTAIAEGEQGACPASCDDQVACTEDTLIGSGCNVACAHTSVSACNATQQDGCCPVGCNANTDLDCSPSCGNGTIEDGERCDTKISAGNPGACPQSCDDSVSCTVDTLVGSGCNVACSNAKITACHMTKSDSCCPIGCTSGTDIDCDPSCGNGILDPKETCDTHIPSGQPGACITAASCDDKVACTIDKLVGSGCTVACANTPISACGGQQKDACCPPGCNANNDADCSATCGNGAVELGETCDTRISAGQQGACPTSCDDGAACTLDRLVGSGCGVACSNPEITACSLKPEGCCPAGCNANSDPDCSAECGNGVVEAEESCDTTIAPSQTGACPQSCDDSIPCTTDKLVGAGCSAACSHTAITTCSTLSDGCCANGCNANNDADCSADCGNGVLEADESCDTAIATGQKGSCPQSCDDGKVCTTDTLVGAACSASCSFVPVLSCGAAEGCCPASCNANNDRDCKPSCGNGVVEAGESCDTAIPATSKGTCPLSCDDHEACTLDTLTGSACTAECSFAPISTCSVAMNDGCCPTGCNSLNDADCLVECGNGVFEPGERCDTGIPTGLKGACPFACASLDPCVATTLEGSACQTYCSRTPITQCEPQIADRCCPAGCNSLSDVDCPTDCGNGLLEAGERCDTAIPVGQKGACPIGCISNMDPCSKTTLLVDGCQTRCNTIVTTQCDLRTADKCCPTGCTPFTDVDCPAVCGNGILEPGERCDTAIPRIEKGSCPTFCLSLVDPCRKTSLLVDGCQTRCNTVVTTQCDLRTADKCCPTGCTPFTDVDCPAVCGNGILEPGERCDTAIPNFQKGACPAFCLSLPCRPATLEGEACGAHCSTVVTTQCNPRVADRCCPTGCNSFTDVDCSPVCGNGIVEAKETCDTAIPKGEKGYCPTLCFMSIDPCRRTTLEGSACTVYCRTTTITECNLRISDKCCPDDCTFATDTDCRILKPFP